VRNGNSTRTHGYCALGVCHGRGCSALRRCRGGLFCVNWNIGSWHGELLCIIMNIQCWRGDFCEEFGTLGFGALSLSALQQSYPRTNNLYRGGGVLQKLSLH
jgi:hypothetical protein